MKRQKLNERDNFTYEERIRIGEKSGHRCCHCGKICYPDYGATIDHFIPLSEGGSNSSYNLIMLCEDCNKKKKSMILRPGSYCTYLNESDKETLQEYFEGYIRSFDFLERRNILACDIYTLHVMPEIVNTIKNKKKRKAVMDRINATVELKRAAYDDLGKLSEYYISYLKKYNCLQDEKTAYQNILFWFKFGCLYFIESAGEIKIMAAITIIDYTHDENSALLNMKHKLSFTIYAYRDTPQAIKTSMELIETISEILCEEQNLPALAIRINGLAKDNVIQKLVGKHLVYERYAHGMFIQRHIVISEKGDFTEDMQDFFDRFTNVERKMEEFIEEYGDDNDWLLDEILPKDRTVREDDAISKIKEEHSSIYL